MPNYDHFISQGFPWGLAGKDSACNAGDLGLTLGLGRFPGRGHGNPLQYSCLENPCEQRSLVGYSPWGCKESDKTERLSLFTKFVPFKDLTDHYKDIM